MVKEINLQFIRDDDCRQIIHRLMDQMRRASYHGGIETTDFLDPYTVEVAESIMRQEPNLSYQLAGGYEEAERKKILFTYGEEEWLQDPEISLYRGLGQESWQPEHREILGSLMGLGIERSKFGDIVIRDNQFFVFIEGDIANYVRSQLMEIGRESISGELISLDGFEYQREVGTIKRISVASLRLDAVVSAIVPTSRGKAQDLIRQERVKVNHHMEKKIVYELSPGDLISIRKSGRFQLGMDMKTSKKGRIQCEIEKF
jgi:RNA-binding protein YlmH